MTQYILKQDDDGHWFVIPADKENEWSEYIEAVYRYWDDIPFDNVPPPTEPEWVEQVGGAPSRVKFSEYTIE